MNKHTNLGHMSCIAVTLALLAMLSLARPVYGIFGLEDSPYQPDMKISPVIAAIILLVVGFVFLVLGIRLFKPIIFMGGLIIGAIIAYTILLNSDHDFGDKQQVVFWLVPLGCGLLLGGLFLWLLKLGILALGGLGGFSLAMWILSMRSNGLINSSVYRPVFIVGMAIAGAVLTLFFEKILIILSTSLFGAGALCAGIDIFVGTGFIQAFNYLLSNQGSFEMNDKLLGLLISYGLLVLFGVFVQLKLNAKSPKKYTQPPLSSRSYV